MRRREGHSLLELVVSLAVVAVVMLAAVGLLREAQVVFTHLGRVATDPAPESALALVRHDVFAARSVLGGGFEWTSGPLTIDRSDGRRAVYRWSGGGLERLEIDALGVVVSTRRLLDDLVDWRWRFASPRLVDLEISYGEGGLVATALAGPPVRRGAVIVDTRLRLSLRGGPGGESW